MERLSLKKIAKPLVIVAAAVTAFSGCTTEREAQITTTEPTTITQVPDTHVQLYPIETGRTDRSEIFKVITLDDGRRIECQESHILDSHSMRSMESCWPAEPLPTTTTTIGYN